MNVRTVLVVGGSADGRAAAIELARRGIEASVVDPAPAPQSSDELVAEARSAGVELRWDVTLVGAVDVDSHVEAELSNGAVENHDAILVLDPGAASLMSAGAASARLAVAADRDDALRVIARYAG